MHKFRAAMVGCGALAQTVHLPNMKKNPRIELVVTCDCDANTAESCRDRFGSERFETDWQDVVAASDVDLIVLATHTNLRGDLIVPALRAGKPVYTEKPLSTSRKEMLQIVHTFRETGVPVCVGHNRRSSTAVIEFKRLLDKARVETSATSPSVEWSSGTREKLPEEKQLQLLIRVNDDARSCKDWVFWDEDGVMFAEMVHFIDLALWFNTAHPVRVFAEGSCRGNFTLVIKFDDGSITTLQHTMVGNFDYPKELIEATVNNVTIAMDQHIEVRQLGMLGEPVMQTFPYADTCDWANERGMNGYMRSVAKEQKRAAAEGRNARWLNVNKGHYVHLDRFLTHIENGGENPCDVESAVPVNRIASKLLESARSGMPIQVGPEDWHLPNMG